MIITLNNFRKWRAKKFILLCICISLAIMPGIVMQNSKMCVIMLVLGLGVYGYLVEQAFMNRDFIAEIEMDEKNVYIKMKKKIYKIERDEIEKVSIREVMYGGKWLQVIGYRLNICTKTRKYHFDSALKTNDNNKSEDIMKLYDMLYGKEVDDSDKR